MTMMRAAVLLRIGAHARQTRANTRRLPWFYYRCYWIPPLLDRVQGGSLGFHPRNRLVTFSYLRSRHFNFKIRNKKGFFFHCLLEKRIFKNSFKKGGCPIKRNPFFQNWNISSLKFYFIIQCCFIVAIYLFFFDTDRSTVNKCYFQNKDGLNRFTLYTAPTNLLPGFEASVAAPLCSGCGSFPFLSERERESSCSVHCAGARARADMQSLPLIARPTWNSTDWSPDPAYLADDRAARRRSNPALRHTHANVYSTLSRDRPISLT